VTQPVIPTAAGKLLDLLARDPGERMLAHVGPAHRLQPGAALAKPDAIFPRYVEAET
jgi:methionyl-tRNA synthetase